MTSGGNKICPACGNSFECKADDITGCQCKAFTFTDEDRGLLSAQYQDCLCANCLSTFPSGGMAGINQSQAAAPVVEKHNLLPVDGEAYLYPTFFSQSTAEKLFNSLRDHINWKQEPIRIMGKEIMQPRLTALYGDQGKSYTYSGVTMKPLPFNDDLIRIRTAVEALAGHRFSTALLNFYRDGKDSMGWHRDNEKSLGQNPVIASVSFGITREFRLKHATNPDLRISIPLNHGSVLIMAGSTQHHWYHSIPKQLKLRGERINITFRKIE